MCYNLGHYKLNTETNKPKKHFFHRSDGHTVTCDVERVHAHVYGGEHGLEVGLALLW